MKEFDYIIIGGGCAGLSLAYELNLHKKLNQKKKYHFYKKKPNKINHLQKNLIFPFIYYIKFNIFNIIN